MERKQRVEGENAVVGEQRTGEGRKERKQRAVGKKGKINDDQFSMVAEKEQFHVARVIELRYL